MIQIIVSNKVIRGGGNVLNKESEKDPREIQNKGWKDRSRGAMLPKKAVL